MRPATVIRSTLKPYWHKRRRKWYARGTYPIRHEDGQIERRRGFIGAGHDSRAACRQECDRLNGLYEQDARRAQGERSLTFAEGVVNYLTAGGDDRFLTERLILEIGHLDCRSIDDTRMGELVRLFFPGGAKPSTINRDLYTPVIAVLRMAAKGQSWKPEIARPKGHADLPPVRVPKQEWFTRVLPACRPQLRALLLLLTLHGRRPKEAMTRLPHHFDLDAGTIEIERTKNGEPVVVRLAKPVIEAILSYDWKDGPGLFGTLTYENRRGAYRMLYRVCEAIGVPPFTFHAAGRHAFATRKLNSGKTLKHIKEAGRWKSMKMVERYTHLERNEVDEETRREGDVWGEAMARAGNIVPLRPKKTVTNR